MIDIIKFL